jgi:hypothetical protein
MRGFYNIILIVLFILANVGIMRSQNIQLDQSKLLEQFIGTWVGEFSDGAKFTCVNEKFSNGVFSKSEIVKENKVFDSIVQIYGYDKKADKIIIAELKESTTLIELCSLEFHSQNEGEIIITNPENAPFNFEFTFKNENQLVQKAIQNGKVVNEIVLNKKI